MCRQCACYFRSQCAYFRSLYMPICGHFSFFFFRSYSFSGYQFYMEGENDTNRRYLRSHVWIFAILLMFCGCFGLNLLVWTKSCKINNDGPVKLCKIRLSVLRFAEMRSLWNLRDHYKVLINRNHHHQTTTILVVKGGGGSRGSERIGW